ncbi:MAG: Holliday junction resolvase RuvX [Patescibacteria group bacterium]|nr:Holliday junction resolvase RuvX [Patescibacteria group bacterium]
MKYLGLDIGEKKIGVAESESGILATPLPPLQMSEKFLFELGKIIEDRLPEKIIFGLPKHQDGSENQLAAEIRQLAEVVKGEFNVEVDFADEYGTTVEAERRLRVAGVNPRELSRYDDSMAAVVILEHYFEDNPQKNKNEKGEG